MATSICTRAGLAALAAALAAFAHAQENILRPLPGSKDIAISGNASSTGSVTSYEFSVEGGLYLTDSLAAVVRFGVVKHSPAQTQLFLGARYEFRGRSSTVPYLLAGLEFHNGQAQTGPVFDPGAGPKATFLEGGAGFDFFLNRYVAAFAEVVAFKAQGTKDVGADLEFGIRMFFK